MWNLIYNTDEPVISLKQNQRHREQTGSCQGKEGWERVGLGVWDCRCKLVYIKRISNKVLLNSCCCVAVVSDSFATPMDGSLLGSSGFPRQGYSIVQGIIFTIL